MIFMANAHGKTAKKILELLEGWRAPPLTTGEIQDLIGAHNRNAVDYALDDLRLQHLVERLPYEYEHRFKPAKALGRTPRWMWRAMPTPNVVSVTYTKDLGYGMGLSLIFEEEARKRKLRAREQNNDDPTQ